MAVLLFPDNTVLINFALINRMDLLSRLANGNGRWCVTVQQECLQSAAYEGLAALEEAGDIFGDPLFPESRFEYLNVRTFRDELAEPNDHPHKHLGEAETLAVMSSRKIHGFFVTDDGGAQRLAARHGIQVIDTWKLMHIAIKKGFVDPAAMWGYVKTLRAAQRTVPVFLRSRESFDRWVVGC
ncbi:MULTISPECIES: hypothetical protein [Arthrobacter]|uniref:PIN domain-containing protein n=1 Tax=Arthrobacter terricola TaxID=2547396 RepID=A0A4R5K6N2_9MICC|nr:MULTISPECIES: hypothetical protein [Arthrobacter]MBT8162200.1 hypothetical protein [Arthrobacter sp. GN70]TDF89138.1 hypothetical protein E1809_23150 [Arthrobacter terricola]